MNIWTVIGLVILALLIILAAWMIGIYNSLVGMRNRVGNGWAQIDVLLKQRADLIPNLVETVKGYAGHESRVLQAVTQARAGAVAAAANPNASLEQRAAAEGELSRAMLNLNAVSEAYPDLKANVNFMDLQAQLRQVEDKIAYARQFYNDVTMKYNTRIQTIPTNIVANWFRFMPAQYFTADEQARVAPQVSFDATVPPQVRF